MTVHWSVVPCVQRFGYTNLDFYSTLGWDRAQRPSRSCWSYQTIWELRTSGRSQSSQQDEDERQAGLRR